MINKVAPINEDFQYKHSDIYVKVYNKDSHESREFEMIPNISLDDFEDHIKERYNLDFPLIQYEDERGDKITIDSDYSFEHALKLADEKSRNYREDMITFEVYISEKEGYVYHCRRCRIKFISNSKYDNDYCDKWEEENKYNRRSATPRMGRSYTSKFSTPARGANYLRDNVARTPTRRAYTPMRSMRN